MWSRVLTWQHSQVKEIGKSRALRWYGAILCLPFLATYFFWQRRIEEIARLHQHLVTCWSFFPGCETYPLRGMGEYGALAYWVFTLAAALLAAYNFTRGQVRPAWWLLLIATCLKAAWQISDYTLMGNYNYMHYLVVTAFLFFPAKDQTVKILLFLFYIFAGLLKLNQEWLTGASIGESFPGVSNQIFPWLLAYVVFLELVIAFGLLSANRWIKIGALAQFFLFHAVSLLIVEFFFPIVMFSLLSLFVLSFNTAPPTSSKSLPMPSVVFLCIFLLAQVAPMVSLRDTSIHTHLRLSALNMLDARVVCEGGIYVRSKNEIWEYIPNMSSYSPRIRCSPVLFRGYARSICREKEKDPNFINVDILLSSRRSTGQQFETAIREIDICGVRP